MESSVALHQKLDIPSEFRNYNTITESDVIVRLEEWRRQAHKVLGELYEQLKQRESLSRSEKAEIIAAVAPFDGEGSWSLEISRVQAQEILRPYSEPEPTFQASPHPMLNTATGRTLPRAAGGPDAVLDHFDGQTWKDRPGMIDLLAWCVRHCESVAYEKLWHLLIPPVMTLLDDYETFYRLRGVNVASDMIQRVPADLLRRTGVDGLLFTSLKKCLAFLQNPETSELIRAAVPTSVSLVLHTTPPGSAKRFDQLCEVLGDGIIGSIWFYAMHEQDAIEATIDVLPASCTRWAIVPQLVFPLMPVPENAAHPRLQLSSLRALAVVIRTCAPRMHKWKGQILEGTLKCWHRDPVATRMLRGAIKEVCDALVVACPSVEYARLLQADRQMFEPLVETSVKA
ncbi:uncharacterized protein B0H18DRAFT_1081270 [Fomitopsis serialis]|uniref:uncharacterized protein n=1 Tax=Fomitopsis serialis TaxID=139415 RepID=UPI002008E7F3|nr:uncharacterized protein B0H18DRAFT_1081270 [Neoantrodia serialis]KAH9938718.1 hypothetical protein B0H18DRAFT_1081270 [Neoantrodia serialis]